MKLESNLDMLFVFDESLSVTTMTNSRSASIGFGTGRRMRKLSVVINTPERSPLCCK